MPFIIYADTESFIRKIDGCANNTEKLSTIWGFDHIEDKRLYEKVLYFLKRTCKKNN